MPSCIIYIHICVIVNFFCSFFQNFWLRQGAQEVTMLVRSSVRSVQTCLELSIFIFLSQISLRSVPGQSQVSPRSVPGQSQASPRSVPGQS